MENLYNYIEETAKKHGYKNITEYCKATGIPRATMSELKAGRTKKLSAKTAQVIFNTLQIPLDMLLGIEPVAFDKKEGQPAEDDGLTNEQRSLIDLAKTASPEQAALAFRVLKSILENDR